MQGRPCQFSPMGVHNPLPHNFHNSFMDIQNLLIPWVSTNSQFPRLNPWVSTNIATKVLFLEQYYGAVMNCIKLQLLDSLQHFFAEMGQHHFFIAAIV